MNKVILMGRLTRDVEMRQTPNGVSLARFSIAVNRRFAGKDAQQQADFINCVAWRQTGEFIARYFQKGSMIAVVEVFNREVGTVMTVKSSMRRKLL